MRNLIPQPVHLKPAIAPVAIGSYHDAAPRILFSDKETIEVKRRRQGTTGGPSGTQRAEAPSRRTGDSGGSSGGGGRPPLSGGSGSSSGGKQKMPLWMAILILVVFGLYSLFTSDSSDAPESGSGPVQPDSGQEVSNAAVNTPLPARPTATAKPRPAASGQQTWTVMLYEDADDQILEEDIYIDINEAERAGSSEQVNIVAQIDRYKGAFKGDGNWTSTRRYYIQQDDDLKTINSELVEELGEVNMADGNTLVDFVTWAAKAYPADRYVLILSDHGMGWPGGWSDADPVTKDKSRIPIAAQLDDNMYLMELDAALAKAQQQAGIERFEIIGMDACLMGHLEVFSALQPYARYAVASQETEPALGWAYTSFLQALVDDPGMDGAELSKKIVDSYISDDQRIVDDQARAEYLKLSSPRASSSQVANQMIRDVTLTAANLEALDALNESVNKLVVALQSEDQSVIADARTYAQSFTNVFGKKPGVYIDLGNFVQILKRESSNAGVQSAADGVLNALQPLVIAEKHGKGKPGATGVSIYFPNSSLYSNPIAGAQSYTGTAQRFAEVSLWDDFLAFHYNDLPIRPDARRAIVPDASAPSRAPGAGKIEVSEIQASSNTAAPGQPVRLSADINGENIGYIYLFAGFYDQSSNSIFIADTDYLESPESREVQGVFYPKWKEGEPFTMALEWEPTVFQISDGDQAITALLNPEQYGVSAEEAVYTVDGTYHYADGESRRARLYFRNGRLIQVFGFTSEDEGGAPWEITPQSGDSFTILETWLDLNANNQVTGTAYQEGQTLTFGEQVFTYQEVFAAAGSYVVGFIVSDMDGNTTEVYTNITVR